MGRWKILIWILAIIIVGAVGYFVYNRYKVSADVIPGTNYVRCASNSSINFNQLYIPDPNSNQFFLATFKKNLQRPNTTNPSILWNSTAMYILYNGKIYISDGLVYQTPPPAASGYLVLQVGNAYYRVDTTSPTTIDQAPATYYAYRNKLYYMSGAPSMQSQNSILFQINGSTGICYNGKAIEVDIAQTAQMIPTGTLPTR